MATDYREALKELEDPHLYVHVPDRNVFEERTETIWDFVRDKDGKPARGKDGKPLRRKTGQRVFDAKALHYIAGQTNRRDAVGEMCKLALGHTVPGGAEKAQPVGVGYARRFRVVFDPLKGKNVIKADFYVRRDKFDEAKTYDEVSPELWPPGEDGDVKDAWFFHPVSLLRRTPECELGQWIYGRSPSGRQVIRYAMEFHMADMPPESPLPTEAPPEPSHGDKVEQYMKHCFSHPYAKHMATHYGMADESVPDGAAPPTEEPDAEAPAQYAALPSATNGAPPAPVQAKPSEQERYARDSDAIRYGRMEKRILALEAKDKEKDAVILQYQRKALRAECEQLVTQLEAEGYSNLDRAEEVQTLMDLPTAEKRTAYLSKIRYGRYERAPVEDAPRIPVDPTRTGGADVDPETGEHSLPFQNRALQYMKKHPGITYPQAADALLKNGGNGTK